MAATAETTDTSINAPHTRNANATPVPERLDTLLDRARERGFRVDGDKLAAELLTADQLARLERLVFEEDALTYYRGIAHRIEFITDGVPPPHLLEEPSAKSEIIYKQGIDYAVCKSCRLCIQVCPKHVYVDDGFGRPDLHLRRPEECTGPHQCAQCSDVCPENAIQIISGEPVFEATVFVLLPSPVPPLTDERARARDFLVPNPLATDTPLALPKKLSTKKLKACNAILDAARFHPLLDTHGYARHFVDSPDPEADLRIWAAENGRDPELAIGAVRLLYKELFELKAVLQGKYRLGEVIHRVIDEIMYPEIKIRTGSAQKRLAEILGGAYVAEPFLGAKSRPIGGLLPAGTSPAWKTPYGEEIPDYTHLEKCLGPECGLCVIHCPEGGGGERSAIRMTFNVPEPTVPALVRGGRVYLVRLDGTQVSHRDYEDLSNKKPFQFEVDPDYCKACGICITCCPHDVIEPMARDFDMRREDP
jgi:2-oxoglutarate ferredoxin oxidoreductase subunit delta